MVGAGVGDEAQELCPFSTSTLCGGRDPAAHGLRMPCVAMGTQWGPSAQPLLSMQGLPTARAPTRSPR